MPRVLAPQGMYDRNVNECPTTCPVLPPPSHSLITTSSEVGLSGGRVISALVVRYNYYDERDVEFAQLFLYSTCLFISLRVAVSMR